MSTQVGDVGWPPEAENGPSTLPLSTVSQLTHHTHYAEYIPPYFEAVPHGTIAKPQADDEVDGEGYETVAVITIRVPEQARVSDQHEGPSS